MERFIFDTSSHTLVCGILNITPDSFSDGGAHVAARFMLASALFSAPALAGVTLVRGAYRLGYREEGRSFFEANMRSMVWMIGAVFLGQMIIRFVPPMSGLMRDYRRVDGIIWKERLGRWFGRAA